MKFSIEDKKKLSNELTQISLELQKKSFFSQSMTTEKVKKISVIQQRISEKNEWTKDELKMLGKQIYNACESKRNSILGEKFDKLIKIINGLFKSSEKELTKSSIQMKGFFNGPVRGSESNENRLLKEVAQGFRTQKSGHTPKR